MVQIYTTALVLYNSLSLQIIDLWLYPEIKKKKKIVVWSLCYLIMFWYR